MKLSLLNIKTSLLRNAIVASIISTGSMFLLGRVPAYAQLRVAPLFQEEQSERGRAQGVITLTNVTDEPVRVRLYSEPFTYEADGFSVLSEDPTDLSPFLQFSPREVVISPMEDQRVRVLSLFPPSLSEGEYRAVIFAEELRDNSAQAEEVAVQVRIGSTLYVRNGDVLPLLSGVSAQVNSDQSVIELLVDNQGKATTRSAVGWQLRRADDIIAQGQGNPQTVIAQGDRIFPLALPNDVMNDGLPDGNYTLTGELYWLNEGQRYVQPFELPISVTD